jgi:hypothetical protein
MKRTIFTSVSGFVKLLGELTKVGDVSKDQFLSM